MSTSADATIKVLLIGDSGVGKSSLMLRFAADTFSDDISATIGIDFKVKEVAVRGDDGTTSTVKMQIWDTAGQERFRTLTSSYYRGAHAVILVYDVNSKESFEHLERWLEEAHSFCSDRQVQYLLVGNKIDLAEGSPAVPTNDAAAFARTNQMLFAQCSAKTKEGVGHAFEDVARCAFQATTGAPSKRGVNLDTQGHQKQDGGACC